MSRPSAKPGMKNGTSDAGLAATADVGFYSGPAVNKNEDSGQQPARPDKMPPPAEAVFYGLVNDSVEQLLINGFGREKWHAVKEKAGLSDVEDGDFEKMQQYEQGLTYTVVGAITEVLGLTAEQALEAAGDNFVANYLPSQGYTDLLRAQGNTLREFMTNMDTMHAYLKRETLPGLAPPSFKTEDAEDGLGFLLHYWSFRPGLWPMVKGMVAAAGRVLFEQETKLEVVRQSEEGGHHYAVFKVMTVPEFDQFTQNQQKKAVAAETTRKDESAISAESAINGEPEIVGPAKEVNGGLRISTGFASFPAPPPRVGSFAGAKSPGTDSASASTPFREHNEEARQAILDKVRLKVKAIKSISDQSVQSNASASPTVPAAADKTASKHDKDKKKGQVASENSPEVTALVFMMHESVVAMRAPEDVEAFAERFSVDQLCSLLRMRGVAGVSALKGLFREPLKAAGGSLRPPHQAFLATHLLVQEHPTPAMHRGITSRYTDDQGEKQCDLYNPPIADQHRIHGLLGWGRANVLSKIELKVCVFPYILQHSVLQAIASSKTPALFETLEVEAILKAAWSKIKYRYMGDCVIEIGLNAVLCVMTEKVRAEETDTRGLVLFVIVLVKEVLEEAWSAAVHRANHRFADYFHGSKGMHWLRLVLSASFIVLHQRGSAPSVQRPVLAGVVISQWFKMLAMCRAFEMLGPKLLPIMYTLKAMGPFLVVLFFYVGAFLHAYWALSARPVGEVFTIGYRLGVMSDFVLETGDHSILEDDPDMDIWLLIWFFVCSALLTLFMMNVVIGVLGESYDVEHDRARVSFLRSRAGICAEYSSRIWKVQKPVRMYSVLRRVLHVAQHSTPRCILWLAATFPVTVCYMLLRCVVAEWHCYDYQGRYADQDTTAPFLWLCVAHFDRGDVQDAEAGRLQIMTNRIDTSLHTIQKENTRAMAVRDDRAAADSARMEKMEKMLAELMDKVSLLAERRPHNGSESESESGSAHRAPHRAPPAGGRCPFSGMPMTAEAFGSRPKDRLPVSKSAVVRLEGDAPRQPFRADGRLPPENILHYGPHLASLEQMILQDHGADAWHAVKEEAGLAEFEDGDFDMSRHYEQETMNRLLRGISEALGFTKEHTLRAVGQFFIKVYLKKHGYLNMLHAQGKNLREMLDNLDAMHFKVEQSFDNELAPPSFKTEDAEDGVGFLLHYWSFREGLWPMVAGQVEASGKVLFDEETKAVVLRRSNENSVYYVLFQVMKKSQFAEYIANQQARKAGKRAPADDVQPERPDQQVPPSEALFYGLVNECVEQLVISGFGREKWHAVKESAGLSDVEDGDFEKMQQYEQGLTYKVVDAISGVMGLSAEDVLEAAGDNFVANYLPSQGYTDLLRAQGKTLREFMGNMDSMHAYLKRETLPGLAPPSFKTEDAEDGLGFLLHYWSFRPGLWPMVKGMVAAAGRVLFEQATKVVVLKRSEKGGHHYVLFQVMTLPEFDQFTQNQAGNAVGGAPARNDEAAMSAEHGKEKGKGHGAKGAKQGAKGTAEAKAEQPARPDKQAPPAEALFYGLVNDSVEQLLINGFGREKWHAVKEKAGLSDVEDGDFEKMQQYEQGLTYKVVGAITEVLGLTAEQALEAAGDNFVANYLPSQGHLNLLRAQGNTLREFMTNMDTMHAYLKRETLPGLAPPSFKTEDAEDGLGFLLHYWSFRPGLWPMVKGMVAAAGRVLFEQETKLEVVRQSEEGGHHYAVFKVMTVPEFDQFTQNQQKKAVAAETTRKDEKGHGAKGAKQGAKGKVEAKAEQPARPDKQAPPAEALFYGLVNDSVEQLLINGFGREKWHAVKEKAGLSDVEDGDFEKMQQYEQGLTYKVVGAITEVLGLTAEQALEAAGDNFVANYLPSQGHLNLLRAQGNTLREFMTNMDTMHAYLKRETLPGLAPPSFKTEDAEDGLGFLLHYWSFRPGLWPMVKGMVAAAGRVLFEQETKLEVVRQSEEGGHHYAVFKVMTVPEFDQFTQNQQKKAVASSGDKKQP